MPSQEAFAPTDGGGSGLSGGQWDNGHALMGINRLRADPRFGAYLGAGLRTVVLDTGINQSSPYFGPDLDGNGVSDRIVYQWDFAHNDPIAADTVGHGSNVASALASSHATYPGVAPESEIIALRVFSDSGAGNFAWLEQGLRWVIANAVTFNIASVNLSLGDGQSWNTPISTYNVGDELATLAQMGVIVVAASGNDYADSGSAPGVAYPAADPNVLAVGAVYGQPGAGYAYTGGAVATASPAGAITPFTQRGSTLDILAPGAPIVGASAGAGNSIMHGTSQASPQIAGIALLAQQMALDLLGRRLSVSEFRTLLISTATTVVDGDDEQDNVDNTGASYPLVDAFALAESIWSMRLVAADPLPNSAPTLSGFEPLTGAVAGRSAVIDWATIAGSASSDDVDGDTLAFRIEQVIDGSLTINGRAVTPGETLVRPGDRIVWTPGDHSLGDTPALSLAAHDGRLASPQHTLLVHVRPHADGLSTRGIVRVSDHGQSSAASAILATPPAHHADAGSPDRPDFLTFNSTDRREPTAWSVNLLRSMFLNEPLRAAA